MTGAHGNHFIVWFNSLLRVWSCAFNNQLNFYMLRGRMKSENWICPLLSFKKLQKVVKIDRKSFHPFEHVSNWMKHIDFHDLISQTKIYFLEQKNAYLSIALWNGSILLNTIIRFYSINSQARKRVLSSTITWFRYSWWVFILLFGQFVGACIDPRFLPIQMDELACLRVKHNHNKGHCHSTKL